MEHKFREANKAADNLAKRGCNQEEAFVIHFVPPADVMSILLLDNSDVTKTRFDHPLI